MDAVGDMILHETSIDYDLSFIHNIEWFNYKDPLKDIMTHQLKELHAPYGGMPSSYTDENTIIYQKFLSKSEIDYEILSQQTNIDIHTVSIIRQRPGNCIPLHVDKFYKLRQIKPDGKPVRANIFVEDWADGHILQFGHELKWDWKKNTGWIFNEHVPHLSGNCGMQDKYTLQLSGFFK